MLFLRHHLLDSNINLQYGVYMHTCVYYVDSFNGKHYKFSIMKITNDTDIEKNAY